jgi:hypothetical protein
VVLVTYERQKGKGKNLKNRMVKCACLSGALLLLCTVFLPLSLPVAGAPPAKQAAKATKQWIGTIQRAPEFAPNTALTLLVSQQVAVDGTITDISPARRETIRLSPASKIVFAHSPRNAVAADLDFGAQVTVTGSKTTTTIQALSIEIEKTASEAMGSNLLTTPADPKSWNVFFVPEKAEGAIEAETGDNAIRVTVRKTAGTDWHAQLFRSAPLKPGATYTLRFRARADVPRLITVDTQIPTEGYRNGGLYQVIPLSDGWRSCRTTFRAADGVTDKDGVKFQFLLGGKTGTIWLSDMTLVEGDFSIPAESRPSPPVGANLVVLPNAPNCWMLKAVPPADAEFVGKDNTLKITVTKLDDKKYVWGSQLFQMIDLEAGRSYTLTFLAKADAPRSLGIWTWIDNGHYNRTGLETSVALQTDWHPYKLTFTAEKTVDGHTKAPCFCVGNALGTIWLSNVSLVPNALTKT